MAADEVLWVSGTNDGALVTMKDGRVLLCGAGFTQEERDQIEKAFAGVRDRHTAYRYGVYGIKENGEMVLAVLAGRDRVLKEQSQRLPEIAHDSYSDVKFIDLSASSNLPVYLTDDGNVWKTGAGWFPRSAVKLLPVEDDVERRKRTRIAQIWNAGGRNFTVTLSKSGRWHVYGQFPIDGEKMQEKLENVLNEVESPIHDLQVRCSGFDNGDFHSYAMWIE